MFNTKLNKIINISLLLTFIVLQLCLSIFNMFFNFLPLGEYIFSIITICFSGVLFVFNKGYKKFEAVLILLGIIFLFFADYFLVLNQSFYGDDACLGVLLFICMQICYMLHLHKGKINKKAFYIDASLRLILAFIWEVINLTVITKYVYTGEKLLTFLIGAYIINSVLNIIIASLKPKQNIALVLGLGTLLICDVLLGFDFLYIFDISIYLNSTKVTDWAFIFYLPAQILFTSYIINFSNKKL